ncbi:outer membrane protein assembly factor BamB family protein [Zavarzinella formosa]|uniref:outer membrane protein assembly factor BamB family protein n=1 Tax=Zavarzinella formosa TaxID=360055 RepID=UPI0002E23DC5|nr:PQQ-binding-like beta-propeller repeat protein [Zavarzinella formosa]
MSSDFRPRVYPAVLILAMIVFASFVPALIAPREQLHFMGMFGGWVLSILATCLWWVTFSKVRGPMRWIPPLLFIGDVAAAIALYPNFSLGMNVVISMIFATTLWLLAASLTRPLGWPVTRWAVPVALLVAVAATWAVRIDGASADLSPELSWRWSKTSEQLAMAERSSSGEAVTIDTLKITPADWAQFRGPTQDSRVTGTKIRTDWDKTPPKEVWKKRIGPGWGSFTVVGDYLFTQEQRGDNEAIVCLKADTGTEAWSYETPGRFAEAISGAGPRATPTVADNSVFAFGATGKLTRLDVRDGRKIWEVEVPAVTETTPPPAFWGYASSPYVAEGLVVVFTNGGATGKGTAAFHVNDGTLAWAAGKGTHGYCTAHRATLAGVDQLLMVSDFGLESFELKTGKVLWAYSWKTPANRSTQPIFLGNDELLLGTGYGVGTRRLKITKSGDDWNIASVWESRQLKPYYNDAVIHNNLVFGFDDKAFVCIDPANGRRKWNAGTRYGFGQVLALPEQNLLLVMAENGAVALVVPTGDDYVEQTSFKALAKKTWNHPVVNRGRLYVRNSEEMACYDLTVAK